MNYSATHIWKSPHQNLNYTNHPIIKAIKFSALISIFIQKPTNSWHYVDMNYWIQVTSPIWTFNTFPSPELGLIGRGAKICSQQSLTTANQSVNAGSGGLAQGEVWSCQFPFGICAHNSTQEF